MKASPLQLEERSAGAWLVLAVTGEVDLYASPVLQTGIAAALSRLQAAPGAASGAEVPRGLVVDLTGVAFMDSAGLGVLVSGYKRARASGTPFRVAGAQDRVVDLFTVIGLTTLLPLHATVGAAVTDA